ncbi:MAG: ATP-binding protein [Gemmatimonadota bacterium]
MTTLEGQSPVDDRAFPAIGLPGRVGILVAIMSLILVLSATEIALSWSQRSRLEDLRQESQALSQTLAIFLAEVAPDGDPQDLASAFDGWSRQHIVQTRAWVLVHRGIKLVGAASSDSLKPERADVVDYEVLAHNLTRVRRIGGADPGWLVTTPIGGPKRYGVLDLKVSTLRLEKLGTLERRRWYVFGSVAALLVAIGVGLLTALWVGHPLRELARAMAGAHGGAEGAPAADILGPPEFRTLAKRYNHLRDSLELRERESRARASLLALEEQARGLDRLALMEETTAGLAHEIGTPLNTLSGHLQLLLDDLRAEGDGVAMNRVDLLLAQVDRMTRIVRAGLERRKWPEPIAQSMNLAAVAADMLRFLEPSFDERSVRVSLQPSLAVVRCDPHMVEQILLNILKNAIEALESGGNISVATGVDSGKGYVEIADDGPGLDQDALDHLFNPFATTKGAAGAGLGLSVSRRLARSMEGDLVYLPGIKGTRWRLTLPLIVS